MLSYRIKVSYVAGTIHTLIDKADLEFTAQFFMSLGEDAKVIEPMEMKEYILSLAEKLVDLYR